MGDVAGFLPSRNGLHFPNSWPHVPILTINVPPFSPIPIGDAANGLCGGMAFAVRDLFDSGLLPPAGTDNPAADSPAFNYLVERLLDSFNLPAGVLQYYAWMQLPAHDDQIKLFGSTLTLVTGTSSLTVNHAMPVIRAAIDAGQPCPLGLIRVHSADPQMLGVNHQVLAWGYDDSGTTTTVKICDSNQPDDDTVTITFDNAPTTTFSYSGDSQPLLGFFPITWYSPKDPSPLVAAGQSLASASLPRISPQAAGHGAM